MVNSLTLPLSLTNIMASSSPECCISILCNLCTFCNLSETVESVAIARADTLHIAPKIENDIASAVLLNNFIGEPH